MTMKELLKKVSKVTDNKTCVLLYVLCLFVQMLLANKYGQSYAADIEESDFESDEFKVNTSPKTKVCLWAIVINSIIANAVYLKILYNLFTKKNKK